MTDRLLALATAWRERAAEYGPSLLPNRAGEGINRQLQAQRRIYALCADELEAAVRAGAALPPQLESKVTGDTSDGYHTFDELYGYRKAFNALLFNEWAQRGLYGVHKSIRHSDGELCFGGGWFIVSAQTPEGQVTNHYKVEDSPLFQVPERERAAEWDGHTPQIALQRLLTLAALPLLGAWRDRERKEK